LFYYIPSNSLGQDAVSAFWIGKVNWFWLSFFSFTNNCLHFTMPPSIQTFYRGFCCQLNYSPVVVTVRGEYRIRRICRYVYTRNEKVSRGFRENPKAIVFNPTNTTLQQCRGGWCKIKYTVGDHWIQMNLQPVYLKISKYWIPPSNERGEKSTLTTVYIARPFKKAIRVCTPNILKIDFRRCCHTNMFD